MRIFPIMEIEVNPDIFNFILNDERLSLKTVVSYKYEKRFTLESIGEKVSGANIVTVNLFDPSETTIPPVEKLWLLSGLIGYGIKKLAQKKNIVFRPHVIYRGDNKLALVLCGYQKSLLRVAALEGGARKVYFE